MYIYTYIHIYIYTYIHTYVYAYNVLQSLWECLIGSRGGGGYMLLCAMAFCPSCRGRARVVLLPLPLLLLEQTHLINARHGRRGTHGGRLQTYLAESVPKFVLQKSIPAKIRQLIHYISNDKG